MRAVRAIVSGRVQGVWFRAWTVEQARARGLDGWVRNRRDGTVEAVFSGPGDRVEDMIAACRNGPPMARVETVSCEDCPAPEAAGFDTRPTA